MKNITLRPSIGIAVFILVFNNLSLFAVSSSSVKKTLMNSPAAEMPATAARIISQASAADKKATTVAAVEAAIGMNPASASSIVGAIAHESPEMAAIAAARAAVLQPKQAGAIAKAAAAAAPKQAAEIVAAIVKELPAQFSTVAIAASFGAPDSSPDILTALAAALPGLKSFIDQARSDAPAATVEAVVQAADQGFKQYSQTHPGASYDGPVIQLTPRVGPPFKPYTPGSEIGRGQNGEVAPGHGRNYST